MITKCPECDWNNLELRLGRGEAKYYCSKCGKTGNYLVEEDK